MARMPAPDMTSMNESIPNPKSVSASSWAPNTTETNPSARFDVVIPAYNEEENIGLVLTALSRQTLQPDRIWLIDDGSTDRTVAYARDFATANNVAIEIIPRQKSIGKTPTLKRQARESTADVEFILDADTILESPNYIERTVEELYKAVGIACACGTILPTRAKDRETVMQLPAMHKFLAFRPSAATCSPCGRFRRFLKAVTSIYRDVYFNDLVKSPFKAFKRAKHARRQRRQGQAEKRVIKEPYRQPFGLEYTREYGRPIGWVILLSAAEKVFFPFALLLMMLLGWWETLAITLAAETAVSLSILGFVARSPRQGVFLKSNYRGLQYFFKGLLVTPIRYLSLLYDLVTIGIFVFHVWILKERKWRK